MIHDEITGHCNDAEELGITLAESLLAKGGQVILEEIYRKGTICGETG
jgi:hydroxymethylbilane synthase